VQPPVKTLDAESLLGFNGGNSSQLLAGEMKSIS
jgi:hypothetical protein